MSHEPFPYPPAARPLTPERLADHLAELAAAVQVVKDQDGPSSLAIAADDALAAVAAELDRTRAELRDVLEGLRQPLLTAAPDGSAFAKSYAIARNHERAAVNAYAALKLLENGFPVGPLPDGKEGVSA